MQWNNDTEYQQSQQDVYADVRTPYSVHSNARENTEGQEFSLSDIQQKLGALNTVQEEDLNSVSPDAMPSEQTLNMNYNRNYAAVKSRGSSRLSTREKIMVASYVMVVLALIVAVTVCGVSVTGSFDVALNGSAQYSELSTAVQTLTAETQQTNFEELDRRATDLGYVDASRSNTMTYTELETRPAQNFSVESNWFDSLCDWFSSVFGG